MSRHAPKLSDLCLRACAARPEAVLTPACLRRAQLVVKPDAPLAHAVLQKLLNALEAAGRLADAALPAELFHASLTRVCLANGHISDTLLERLATRSPALVSVDLTGCFDIWDAGVEALLRRCASLRELRLENCRKLTDASLRAMVAHGGQLRVVGLGGLVNTTALGVQRLLQEHPRRASFAALHLSGLALHAPMLRDVWGASPRLASLSLGFSRVTDEDVAGLAAALTGLRVLALHWCELLTDAALAHLGSGGGGGGGGGGASLQEVNLTGNKKLTNAALAELCAPSDASSELRLRLLRCKFTGMQSETAAFLEKSIDGLRIIN